MNKRDLLPPDAECACGEYRTPCLTVAIDGKTGVVKCLNCAAKPDWPRWGNCPCCRKVKMPLDAHHPFGWRIGGGRSRPKSWRRSKKQRPPKLDEIIVGVCRNCHMTMDIMLRWLTKMQAKLPMTPGFGFVSIYAGRLALAITARSRGDVELQQFLEATRQIKFSREART